MACSRRNCPTAQVTAPRGQHATSGDQIRDLLGERARRAHRLQATPASLPPGDSNPSREHPRVDCYKPTVTRRPRSPPSHPPRGAPPRPDFVSTFWPSTSKKAASPPGETASDLPKRGTEGTRFLDPLHRDARIARFAAHRAGWRRLVPSPFWPGHDRDPHGVTTPPYRDLPGCLGRAGVFSSEVCGHFLSTRTPCARCTAPLAARTCRNDLPHYHQVKSRRAVRWVGLIRAGWHGRVRR